MQTCRPEVAGCYASGRVIDSFMSSKIFRMFQKMEVESKDALTVLMTPFFA